MTKNNKNFFLSRILISLLGLMVTVVKAGLPVWTIEPLTATTLTIPANSMATVQYQVTNQSSKPHTLAMQSIQGITQSTNGVNICGNPFFLQSKNSCILSLQINSSQLKGPIMDGPLICQNDTTLQCYRPNTANILRITPGAPILDAVITVTGSPLSLTANGPSSQLIINNTSNQLSATNIVSNFSGTPLDGNVTETGNTCANVPPGGSCTLSYTPGNTLVPQTNFTIQGSNTNILTAAISIQSGSTLTNVSPNSGPAAGGAGVTMNGTGLTGATAVTFGGTPATSVNVINSTTITAVTPAHAIGIVDVVINTPAGGATLTNGYNYLTTTVGQASNGGIIACLNGGLNNLIAASVDNTNVAWGGFGIAIGSSAQSNTDGASNTSAIINTLGPGSYAARICSEFEIDSQGNTPCQAGNTCYNDWFLPAGNNSTATGQLNCLYVNQAQIGGFASAFYWSSTELSTNATNQAWVQDFSDSFQGGVNKDINFGRARCVRAFNP